MCAFALLLVKHYHTVERQGLWSELEVFLSGFEVFFEVAKK